MHHLLISLQISLVWVSRTDTTVVLQFLLSIYSMLCCLVRVDIVRLPLPPAGLCRLRLITVEWDL